MAPNEQVRYRNAEHIAWHQTPADLDEAILNVIERTDVVLDLGCGIRPQRFFRPRQHICVEAHQEYIDVITNRFASEPGFIVVRGAIEEILPRLSDRSVDSIFLIDVIEHLEKPVGHELIREMTRVARRQIVIFTPLGFMPQDYEKGDTDGWGLSGGDLQKHRSGWTPDDFGAGWRFYACDTYHHIDSRARELDNYFGAFWAVHDLDLYHEMRSLPRRTYFVGGEELRPLVHASSAPLLHVLAQLHPDSFILVGVDISSGAYGSCLQTEANRLPCHYIDEAFFDSSLRNATRSATALSIFRLAWRLRPQVIDGQYEIVASSSTRASINFAARLLALLTGRKYLYIDPAVGGGSLQEQTESVCRLISSGRKNGVPLNSSIERVR